MKTAITIQYISAILLTCKDNGTGVIMLLTAVIMTALELYHYIRKEEKN